MDTAKFDGIARLLGNGLTRREAVRGLVATGVAVTAGASALDLVEAKRRKRRKNKKGKGRGKVLAAGEFCQTDAQCGPEKTHRICDVALNASNSDETCCGATGATCGAPNGDGDDTYPYCCYGYYCYYVPGEETGHCQPLIPQA